MEILDINTNGWTDITCDKCGSCTSFDPSVKFEDMKCLACMPETSPEEFDRMAREGLLK
jgi:hypothetical protein